jgi:hypothetical protein
MPGAYELAKVIYRKEPSENNGAVLIWKFIFLMGLSVMNNLCSLL